LKAFGTVQATAEMIPALRQCPGAPLGEPLPPLFLKHSDEQTIAGLAAVYQAIHAHGLASTSFTDWGVLAAPRSLGRAILAQTLQRFPLEGAWGVSPHLVPHRSLHSVSGTISQALAIHGPNFGVGGGPLSAAEVMLCAAAMVESDKLPGIWVILTGWNPELVLEKPGTPHRNGHHRAAPRCIGIALALAQAFPGWRGSQFHFRPREAEPGHPAEANPAARIPFFSLEGLLEALGREDPCIVWNLGRAGQLELEKGSL
jgi:hypothetical protein